MKFGYADKFNLDLSKIEDNMERIDARVVSKEEFVARFEKPGIPVVITHAQDTWQAQKKWSLHVRFFFSNINILPSNNYFFMVKFVWFHFLLYEMLF